MKVSYQWLSQYVDVSGFTAAELAEKLTRSGVEVDFVENRNKGVEGVYVGFVKSREKHPDADKLSICKVDVGQGEDLQIVCGAKNVDAGQKVPVAIVGAKLPDGLNIKRAKLRGVESQGMICSAKELGLNDKLLPKEIQEGILVLPDDTEIGQSILDVLAINDHVLDLDLTPNRSDCLSMLGVAYEIAAILDRPVLLPDTEQGAVNGTANTGIYSGNTSTSDGAHSARQASAHISVEITAKEQCSHYAAKLIEGVRIGTSPLWMQNRLMAAGLRPINNIVDITNYVMLEYGQPLHAFDADKLDNGHIDVRLAEQGEKLITLDGVERTLDSHMLLITDGTKPVAIAGVMGGENSEVTAGTTRILLESAKFDGGTVRKTSRQLGLRSEASQRFEKEANPEAVLPALHRAAFLMSQYAGGQIASGVAESIAQEHKPVRIDISVSRINDYLGTALSTEEVKGIFDRLHFAVETQGDKFSVHVPSRRGDITRAVDLIEEVARLYGYDNIPTTLMTGVTTPGALNKEQSIRRLARTLLAGSGLYEAVTYSFTHPQQINDFPGAYKAAKPIALSMPMSEERSTLRTSLIPHLLEAASYNRNRNTDDVALFEIGKVFVTDQSSLSQLPDERLMLAILLTGKRQATHWSGKSVDVDFYDLKGVFENLASYLGIAGITGYVTAVQDGFHPGRTANITLETAEGITVIGTIGQLHPALQQQKDLADTYLLEVDFNALSLYADEQITYSPLPRYPSIGRDLAVVVNRDVQVGELTAAAKEVAGALLESIQVFDIYTGDRLGMDKKSVALALVYRTGERTLTDEEVSELHARVLTALEQSFGAELRK